MTTYSQIVQQAEWDGTNMRVIIPAEWGQGRTIFGGLSVALALHAMQQSVASNRPLRSVLTSFVGPVRAGELTISAKVLRAGRNVTHVEAHAIQSDAHCCSILACFGRDRKTPVHITPPPMPHSPAPDDLITPPFVPGVSPEFTRFIDYRWATESIPYLGNGTGSTDGWIRLHEDAAIKPDLLALIADAWPSPALAMLHGPAPISSLTWNLEILDLDPAHRANDWWRIHACIDSAASGYVHGDALIWAPDGSLAARSRQTVSVYNPEQTR